MLRQTILALGAVCLTSCAQTSANESPSPIAVAAPAAHPDDELLERLIGRWTLTGTIAGQSTVHDVEANWALQRTYVRIEEVSRESGENGLPAYEATIFIGRLEDRYVCIWLDNTEVAAGGVTCSAPAAPDAFPFEFHDATGMLIFTNTFTYNRSEDAWVWRMVNPDGSEFGLVTLRRSPN